MKLFEHIVNDGEYGDDFVQDPNCELDINTAENSKSKDPVVKLLNNRQYKHIDYQLSTLMMMITMTNKAHYKNQCSSAVNNTSKLVITALL